MSENKVNLLDFDRNALRAFLPMNWAKSISCRSKS